MLDLSIILQCVFFGFATFVSLGWISLTTQI